MTINFETLELLPEERETVRERIRCLAYEKWAEAGCPEGESVSFWLQAGRTWIEHEYVPHRNDK